MKLSKIEHLDSFALLGPGFTDGPFALHTPLRAAQDGSIAFVPYEATAAEHLRFDGPQQGVTLEKDVAPVPLAIELDQSGHRDGVQAIREAIAAGDVYQVNLTLRARLGPVSGSQLFATLCRRAVPRFCAWVRLPNGTEFVSASPELFFEIEGRTIRCEPMKGTAPGNAAAELEKSRKDQAELAMITDLVRNDLTPICVPRTVRVINDRRFLELPYAIQTVSDVAGELLPHVSLSEILSALHPAGSITGAPKHVACTMIQQLERSPRGAYCGTLGYVQGSRAVFSLLIRTASRTPDGWSYGVGGGIVWGSDPDHELEEARLKLGALR